MVMLLLFWCSWPSFCPLGFFQGLDNQCCCRGNHIDLSLMVLNGQSDSDLQAFPFLDGLGDVVTSLLGGQTQWTDLGGQGGSGRWPRLVSVKENELHFIFLENSVIPLFEKILQKSYECATSTGKSLSEALLFAEHGENILCTKIALNVRNNFCTQNVLPRFELGIFM